MDDQNGNCDVPDLRSMDPEPAGPVPTIARPDRIDWRTWLGLLGLTFLVAVAYGQTLRFDLVWDDHVLVVGNLLRRGSLAWLDAFTGPTSPLPGQMPGADRMYRPFLALSVAADRMVWGSRPGAYHLSSVLAHLGVVLLLWRLAWRLTGSRGAAFVAGALLAVHPSAVEAVAFLSARMDLFVGLGMVSTLLLVRNCLRVGGGWRLAGALACFAFALGSKETAIAIPAMVTWGAWIYPEWVTGPGRAPRPVALVTRVAPFWVVLGLYGGLRRAVVGSLTSVSLPLSEVPQQVLGALVAISTDARMILLPRPVSGHIRVEPPAGPADPRVLLGLAVVALVAASLLWLRRRHPTAALALGCIAAALVPVSNVLPIYWKEEIYASERSLYPALVGWCLLLAIGVHAIVLASKDFRHRQSLAGALGVAVGGTFLLVTVVKAGAWRDDVTLWTAASATDPGSAFALSNLGMALANSGDLERAQVVARQATALSPADPHITYLQGWIAELHGKHLEALYHYERAIALGARDAAPFRQAATMAARSHEWDRAGRWLTASAERFPANAWPHVGLGWYQERQGRVDLARAHFARAAASQPNAPDQHWFLAQLLAAEGRVAEAVQACEAALALDPGFVPARRALALLAEREGRIIEAIDQWKRIQAQPGSHRGEAGVHLQRLETMANRGLPRQE